jgi:L-aminopeptidase/D-esterase-like protein
VKKQSKSDKTSKTRLVSRGEGARKLPAGLKIGHAHDPFGLTGCTVLLFDPQAQAKAEIRGSGPATSDFSRLDPLHASGRIDAICFTGGSSFGHGAAVGVARFLEDQGRGFDVGVTCVPNVPSAAIFDLIVGDYTARPTPQMALDACLAATDEYPQEGSVGVGMGATVGKFLGIENSMRGGFGVASAVSPNGAEIWAFAAVNSFGDVWEAGRGKIIAGARKANDSLEFANSGALIASGWQRLGYGGALEVVPPENLSAKEKSSIKPSLKGKRKKLSADLDEGGPENTTLVAVVTTAALDSLSARKLAEASHCGLSDVVYPAYTIYDGDLTIAASCGKVKEDLSTLCVLAQKVVSEAIISAVSKASSIEGIPSARDLLGCK